MAEVQNIVFSHRELAEILIKKQGLHEGLWMIYVEFGLGAGNIGQSPEQVSPGAVVQISKIGIQRLEKDNPLAQSPLVVDAAQVNPAASEPEQPSEQRPSVERKIVT